MQENGHITSAENPVIYMEFSGFGGLSIRPLAPLLDPSLPGLRINVQSELSLSVLQYV